MPNLPYKHGGPGNGGFRALVSRAKQGQLWPWDITSEHIWEAKILAADIGGPSSTQHTLVTIPAAGFVSGRVTLTFSGGPVGSPVEVVADAAVGDANTDLGDALVVALTAAASGSLDGVLASADNSASASRVSLDFEPGVGLVTVTPTWRSAQVTTVTLSGTLIDADYTVTIDDGGGSPVAVPTTRSGGSPATIADMIVQRETDLEALIATTLADILVSADDDGATLNTLTFEPDIDDVTVTTSLSPNSIALAFGGTETNGDYSTTFSHSSLPAGSATVTTTRAGGVPATNIALAAQHETDIEAEPQLFMLVADADDDGAGNTIVTTHPGVTALTATTSAPPPGTLTQTPLGQTVADATPAGPTITVEHSVTLALGDLCPAGTFPAHAMRHEVSLEVDEAFGAGRTITVGDEGDPNGLLGDTPVSLNATGRALATAADNEYRTRYEPAQVPVATIDLGASFVVTAGIAYVQIECSPHPSMTARP